MSSGLTEVSSNETRNLRKALDLFLSTFFFFLAKRFFIAGWKRERAERAERERERGAGA
jgi:hypothetical protein